MRQHAEARILEAPQPGAYIKLRKCEIAMPRADTKAKLLLHMQEAPVPKLGYAKAETPIERHWVYVSRAVSFSLEM